MFRRSNPSLTRDDVTKKETIKTILLVILLFALVSIGGGFIGYSMGLNDSRKRVKSADKDALYYRTQYLKANGQLIEIKNNHITY